MPDLDGLTVLDRLRAREPAVAVVVLTAFGGADRALEAVRRGAFHYVEKPVNIRALVQTLHRAYAVRDGRPLGEEVFVRADGREVRRQRIATAAI